LGQSRLISIGQALIAESVALIGVAYLGYAVKMKNNTSENCDPEICWCQLLWVSLSKDKHQAVLEGT